MLLLVKLCGVSTKFSKFEFLTEFPPAAIQMIAALDPTVQQLTPKVSKKVKKVPAAAEHAF